jgi:predicted DCC family thiol-disulfide oxidoreductase YuxK
MTPGTENAVVIYDGECIFCQSYVRMLRLRDSVGPVELLDARSTDPRVSALIGQGFDLDQGMLFLHKGRIYHGADAIHALALLSSRSSLLNRLNATILSNATSARLLYPWLKAGRRITLWARGRRLIGATAKPGKSGISF